MNNENFSKNNKNVSFEKKREETYQEKNKKKQNEVLEREILRINRVVKVTKGGRRFKFTGLTLVKDPHQNSISFSYVKDREMGSILRKSLQKAKKRMVTYFSETIRTVPQEIMVKYKATRIIIKPASAGTGIKAGSALGAFFKYLNIKDVSAKIIGSKNKTNVLKAAFLALDKMTGKKYIQY